MASRWALLGLLVALLAPCSAVGTQAAMEALRAAWAPQGWDPEQPYCTWPGVVCNSDLFNVTKMYAANEIAPT